MVSFAARANRGFFVPHAWAELKTRPRPIEFPMAISLINTECKRYGCIKNLLACYANCRYSTRCDDLRNEIIDKTELASSDINKYLVERGRTPITIQLMKRGLKFADAESLAVKSSKPRGALFEDKPLALPRIIKSPKRRPHSIDARKRTSSNREPVKKLEPVLTKIRKSAVMPRRPKKESNLNLAEKEQISNPPVQSPESSAHNKPRMTKPARSKKRKSSSGSRSVDRNGKVYIILEGKSASVVDEHALMMHLFTNPSSGARYFEASEVEARVQITKK